MTALDTIAASSSGVTNVQKNPLAKGQTGDAAAGNLFGFITTLLQNAGLAQTAQPQGAAQTSADPAQDLLAKIAALLQNGNGKIDMAALQQLLPPDLAQALAQQMAAAQDQPFMPTLLGDKPAAPAGLTSDLTANIANQVQQTPQSQDNTDPLAAIAAQLNALEPGASADVAVIAAENDSMAALLALQVQQAAPATEAPAPLSPLAQQAATAQAAALRASTSAQNDAGATPLGPVADAASGEPQDGSARGITPASETSTANGGKAGAQAQLMGSTASAAVAQAAAASQARPEAPVHPATVNSMLGAGLGSLQGAGAEGFGSGDGFGQQNGFAQNAANPYGMAADTSVKTAGNQPAFINYMSGARAAGPTTQMVGVQMSRNAASQIDTFTMQLDPADLGRLEVRMSFGRDGKMTARLIADKPETLSLLQRDSAQLEKVLQQSGLEVGENALSFDLREGNQQSLYEGRDRDANGIYAGRGDHALDDATLTAQIAVEAAGYISQTGVNIMV